MVKGLRHSNVNNGVSVHVSQQSFLRKVVGYCEVLPLRPPTSVLPLDFAGGTSVPIPLFLLPRNNFLATTLPVTVLTLKCQPDPEPAAATLPLPYRSFPHLPLGGGRLNGERAKPAAEAVAGRGPAVVFKTVIDSEALWWPVRVTSMHSVGGGPTDAGRRLPLSLSLTVGARLFFIAGRLCEHCRCLYEHGRSSIAVVGRNNRANLRVAKLVVKRRRGRPASPNASAIEDSR